MFVTMNSVYLDVCNIFDSIISMKLFNKNEKTSSKFLKKTCRTQARKQTFFLEGSRFHDILEVGLGVENYFDGSKDSKPKNVQKGKLFQLS